MIWFFYPQSVARHGLRDAVRHYEHRMVQITDMARRWNVDGEYIPPSDGRPGSSSGYIPSNRFFQESAQRTFGGG